MTDHPTRNGGRVPFNRPYPESIDSRSNFRESDFEKKKKDTLESEILETQARTCKKLASKGTVESILKNA